MSSKWSTEAIDLFFLLERLFDEMAVQIENNGNFGDAVAQVSN